VKLSEGAKRRGTFLSVVGAEDGALFADGAEFKVVGNRKAYEVEPGLALDADCGVFRSVGQEGKFESVTGLWYRP
jgi:hypothetical protein